MIPKSGYRFSEKIMLNNNLKRNDASTHVHFASEHDRREAARRSTARSIHKAGGKNHDGRACARPSRSLRCYPQQGNHDQICHLMRRW
jgi:hypothetical protein